jgi:hypothetical protein
MEFAGRFNRKPGSAKARECLSIKEVGTIRFRDALALPSPVN